MSKKRRMGNQKFCPLTAQKAKDWYQKKYLSTAGYLLVIKEILRPPGVDLQIQNVSQFCSEWGISRAAFYRALSTINVNNDGTWQTSGAITLSTQSITEDCLPSEQLSHERTPVSQANNCLSTGHLSHERDAESHERDTESHERDTKSHERDTQALETSHSNSSGSLQTYTDFIQTLSDSQRENFFSFVEEKIKDFSPSINDLQGWLAGQNKAGQFRWQVYWELFQQQIEADQPEDWRNHPEWSQALEVMAEMGHIPFVTQGGEGITLDRTERLRLMQFARENGYLTGGQS